MTSGEPLLRRPALLAEALRDVAARRGVLAARRHARRLSTLAELSDAAVFIASDKASGLTGTIVNLSLGSLDD